MNDIAPFNSPENAIRFAYRMESRDVAKISSYLGSLRGSTVRGKRDSDGPWDDHAQAAIIISMIGRHTSGAEMVAIRARHTIPSSASLELRKNVDCKLLTEHVRSIRILPASYIYDICREWAGYRREYSDSQWAKKLNVHAKTLFGWRCGRIERKWAGIVNIFDCLEITGISKLHGIMLDSGLTRN